MKKKISDLLFEAADLVYGVEHMLANTRNEYDLNAKDCYQIAGNLERAFLLLVTIGDRKMQNDLNEISKTEEVPF
jgi:hypothetical protein